MLIQRKEEKMKKNKEKSTYSESGVNIDLAQGLLKSVKEKISSAKRPEMLSPIGGFGGLFEIDLKKYKNPVLVSSIDGIGTKLLVAMMMEKYDTLGADIVNHCINDIAVYGAEPISFLDYFGTGKLKSPCYEHVLSSIADACKESNCAFIGGETAEMPGMYGDDFDIVGTINGVVDKNSIIDGSRIKSGHIAIGLSSNGLHTNGYSLARHVLFNKAGLSVATFLEELGETVGDALLHPHICYRKAISVALEQDIDITGMAHITGGGLYDNVPRVLPDETKAIFKKESLPIPPIFKIIQREGNIEDREMYRIFNMGIGMVWFLPENHADEAINICNNLGFNAGICGHIETGAKEVEVI